MLSTMSRGEEDAWGGFCVCVCCNGFRVKSKEGKRRTNGEIGVRRNWGEEWRNGGMGGITLSSLSDASARVVSGSSNMMSSVLRERGRERE